MKYYKPTEAELDWLADLGRDAGEAFGWMSFCLGILANVIVGLVFATGLSTNARGIAITIAVFSVIGAIKFGYDGQRKRTRERTELQRIKDDHDFTVV